MSPADLSQFLIAEYGLTRREALFTAKLVEGKSMMAASQESSMTTSEARTALNRVLLKVPCTFPLQVSPKIQVSNRTKQSLREVLYPAAKLGELGAV